MKNRIQFGALAAAVAACFATSAGATTLHGAGASAVNNTLKSLLLDGYCDTTKPIDYYDDGTFTAGKAPGGGVYRIICTPKPTLGTKFASGVDISYDTNGGSWKGFLSTNNALFPDAQNTAYNADPAKTVATTCAAVQSGYVVKVAGANRSFNYHSGCTDQPLTSSDLPALVFGMTDVEAGLFNATTDDQPLVNNSWNGVAQQIYGGASTVPWGTGTDKFAGGGLPAFGVVMGIAASSSLWTAMQADQIAAGWIASSCSTVTAAAVSAGVFENCAPIISKAQYASIASANFGSLNTDASGLFFVKAPADVSLEFARRDQGSGTQSSANAYFLNDGCASTATEASDLAPVLPSTFAQVTAAPFNNFQVTYNGTTGKVITRLTGGVAASGTTTASPYSTYVPPTPTSGFVIGHVSAENDSASRTWGFLRLEGFYPSTTNGAAGLYTYVTEENLHCSATVAGDALSFCTDLSAPAGAVGAAQSYTGVGIVQTAVSNYNNNGLLCAGLRHK